MSSTTMYLTGVAHHEVYFKIGDTMACVSDVNDKIAENMLCRPLIDLNTF